MERTSELSLNNEQILLPLKDREAILYDLFSQWDTEEGIKNEENFDSSFLYGWEKWVKLYTELSESDDYPYTEIEMQLLYELIHDPKIIDAFKDSKQLIDSGSWNGRKGALLLRSLIEKIKTGIWLGKYIGEDKSPDMRDQIVQNFRELKLHNYLWGFFTPDEDDTNSIANQFKRNFYLFLWCTIWNMSDTKIISKLKNMSSSSILSWNKILLSYYKAPKNEEEIERLKEVYNSEKDIAFHKNGMAMLWLSEDDFEYEVVYEEDLSKKTEWSIPWRIKWIIKVKRDMDNVTMTDWNVINKKIKAWQQFTIHYSRRFSEEEIKSLFKKSGCSVVTRADENDNGLSIVLLHKKPTKISQFVAKHRTAVYSALATVLLWLDLLWVSTVYSYVNEKRDNNKTNELMELYSTDYLNRIDYKSRRLPKYEFDLLDRSISKGCQILFAEYNISPCIKEKHVIGDNRIYYINEVLDLYREKAWQRWHKAKDSISQQFLQPREYVKEYVKENRQNDIIEKYVIPYQDPYEHFSEHKDIIKNTLEYWNTIDISKHRTKEVSIKTKVWVKPRECNLWYYNDDTWRFYNLKVVRVFDVNWKDVDLFVWLENPGDYKTNSSIENFSLADWVACIKDLVNKYPYVQTSNYWDIKDLSNKYPYIQINN